MKQIVKAAVLLVGVGVAAIGLRAVANDASNTAYQAIIERNAFGLKPIAPPPPPVQPPNVVTNIKFTGITIRPETGVKKAWFVIPDPDQPHKPNAFIYPSLQEGESVAGVELVSIDEKENSVKIITGGKESELTFASNSNPASPPATVGAAPVGGPVMTPGAPLAVPQPPVIGRQVPIPGSIPPGRIINPGGGGYTPAATGSFTTPATSPNTLQTMPARTVRIQPNAGVPDPAAQLSSMINMEAQRAVYQDAINAGQFPPLPPTGLLDAGGGAPPPGGK